MDIFIRGQNKTTGRIDEFRKTAWDYVCSRNNGTHPTHIKVGEYEQVQLKTVEPQNGFSNFFNISGCKGCGR